MTELDNLLSDIAVNYTDNTVFEQQTLKSVTELAQLYSLHRTDVKLADKIYTSAMSQLKIMTTTPRHITKPIDHWTAFDIWKRISSNLA